MSRRRLAVLIAAGLALSGCCPGSGCYVQPAARMFTGWDEFGPVAKRSYAKRAKVRKTIEAAAPAPPQDDSPSEAQLSKLKPYSKEWTALYNAMNSAADARLKKKLIICRGCLPSETDDVTSSIGAGGYVALGEKR